VCIGLSTVKGSICGTIGIFFINAGMNAASHAIIGISHRILGVFNGIIDILLHGRTFAKSLVFFSASAAK